MSTMRSAAVESLGPALRELREVGGQKRWLFCSFGYDVATALVEAGWATIDAVPVVDAFVRLTEAGRLEIDDASQ